MNFVRVETLGYFYGGDLDYSYGAANSVNDRISRLQTYDLEGVTSNLAVYEYLGVDVLAVLGRGEALGRIADAAG